MMAKPVSQGFSSTGCMALILLSMLLLGLSAGQHTEYSPSLKATIHKFCFLLLQIGSQGSSFGLAISCLALDESLKMPGLTFVISTTKSYMKCPGKSI